MMTIFISSVQKELAAERRALKSFVNEDALLRQFFTVFLFEDQPASDHRADEVYISEVDRCAVYVGLFGNDYGFEDADGISPTEREFTRATESGKPRLIFVKGTDDSARHPKMKQLIRKAGDQLIRRRFNGNAELTSLVYASLVDFLQERGIIRNRPFDDTVCLDATIDDIDNEAVTIFVRRARNERQFPFDQSTPANEVLTHLGLLRGNNPTNSAILLFGRNPQQFIPCAEVRCMHFHGTEIQRPAPFYRIFKGTLFSQVDQAANFVLSVTNLSVGTRALGNQAPVTPEIPPDVVREAVVNAIAHRDYSSSAAIQVAVFSDRVEVWNPGELPAPLTPESLRHPHRSIARNHRICESLFLAGYIEKYGTGTLMMIRESIAHELPEPQFQQRGGEFATVIGRDWLTEQVLAGLGLNDRQYKAVMIAKEGGRLDNMEYQKLFNVSKPTASRDLDELTEKGVLAKSGTTGKGTHYALIHKGLIKGSMGSQRAQWAQTAEQNMNITKDNKPQNTLKKQRVTNLSSTKSALNKHQVGTKAKPSRQQVTGEVTGEVAKLLAAVHGNMSRISIQQALNLKHEDHFRSAYLVPAIHAGLIEMTLPDKPKSRLQKYRITDKGRAWLIGKSNESD
jgi:ATP-dependent DNA helicase RecG